MSVFFRVAQALFLHLLLFVVVIIYIVRRYIDTRFRKKQLYNGVQGGENVQAR